MAIEIVKTIADIITAMPSRLVGTGSFRPGVSGDDGTWYSSSSISITGNLVIALNSGWHRSVWLRFPAVTIPAGSVIHSATITFKAAASNSANSAVFDVYFNDENDAVAPTTASSAKGKTKTDATVNWNLGKWTSGQLYSSPDLKALIQEVVDRPGWAAGNAMMALLIDTISADYRQAISYDTDPGAAALLEVEYDYSP